MLSGKEVVRSEWSHALFGLDTKELMELKAICYLQGSTRKVVGKFSVLVNLILFLFALQ